MERGDASVILVGDHLAVRTGLRLLLGREGVEVCGVTDSVDEGYRMFNARRPDVAVIDVELAQGSGVELAARILDQRPDAGVLIYTGLSERAAIERAANCGARGFALKSSGPTELVNAIRTVAAGGVSVDAGLARLLAPRASAGAVLTRREREVFDLLANGLPGEEVAAQLFLSPETVRTHVRNGMRKLGARTRVHAIALAVRLHEISL